MTGILGELEHAVELALHVGFGFLSVMAGAVVIERRRLLVPPGLALARSAAS